MRIIRPPTPVLTPEAREHIFKHAPHWFGENPRYVGTFKDVNLTGVQDLSKGCIIGVTDKDNHSLFVMTNARLGHSRHLSEYDEPELHHAFGALRSQLVRRECRLCLKATYVNTLPTFR